MPGITSIKGRICYNSRGQKTVEVDVVTDNRYLGRACAPSGASVGRHEATSFPRGGAEAALSILHDNASKFIGLDASNPKNIHDILRQIDDSPTYNKIGGSVAYALSIAAAESAAKTLDITLFKLLRKDGPYRFPLPLGNVLGGGAHAGLGTPDIQEVLVVPIGAKSVQEALKMNFTVHRELRDVITRKDRRFTFGRGDEGAWAPKMNNTQALDAVEKTCQKCGFKLRKDIAMGVDFATSSLWNPKTKTYVYGRSGKKLAPNKQVEFVSRLIKDYKLMYVEDPVHEEAFEDMAELTKRFKDVYVTGDDMLVTSSERLAKAIEYGACNSAILKVNQAGSLYDAMIFAEKAAQNNIKLVTSHRSGESTDAHISHIAIATGSRMIKTGVLGGERVAKLNELLRLSEAEFSMQMAEV